MRMNRRTLRKPWVPALAWLPAFIAVACGGGCGPAEADSSDAHPDAASRSAVQARPADGSGAFSCEPAQVGPADTLVLRMPSPHGAYLAIRAPGGAQFFLVYPQLGDTTGPPPIMAAEEFQQAPEVRLAVGGLRSSPWTSAEVVQQPVFEADGEYEITVAENLETDLDLPSSTCTVRYSAQGSR